MRSNQVSPGGRPDLDHDLGIAEGGQAHAAGEQLLAQLAGVDQVAVVGQGHRADHGFQHEGLGAYLAGGIRCGIAHVADGNVALEGPQVILVEHLGNQAHLLVQRRAVAVGDGDAGALLPTVLQGEQPEESHSGHGHVARENPKDATSL
jgi:hypothetical protein